MDLFEHQAKELFARHGVAVPRGRVAWSPGEAQEVAAELGGTVVVKAQVQVGGRGKAGGIQLARDPAEARAQAERIIGMDIKGHVVRRVLVEEASDVAAEYYASILHDRAGKGFLAMASTQGGVDIEEVAARSPEAIVKVPVNPLIGLRSYHVSQLLYGAGFAPAAHKGAAEILGRLYQVLLAADCTLVEVNPLVLTADGQVKALDAKVSLDDSALVRHPELEALRDTFAQDPQERAAKERGLNYVKLDGWVGIVGNGAGLVMSTLDVVAQAGGRAANFLDVGVRPPGDPVGPQGPQRAGEHLRRHHPRRPGRGGHPRGAGAARRQGAGATGGAAGRHQRRGGPRAAGQVAVRQGGHRRDHARGGRQGGRAGGEGRDLAGWRFSSTMTPGWWSRG